MTKQELKKCKVIEQVIQKVLTNKEAAELLKLSTRQIIRLKQKFLEEGEEGLIHKNRGRKPKHALSDEAKQGILNLLISERYKGCNDCHFSDLLKEYEGIQVSPSTIRRIRLKAGLISKRKKRRPKVYRPRERKHQEGILWQTDASIHDWLEGRGPIMTLHAIIDDATGKVVAGVFRPNEDMTGYFEVMKTALQTYGVPIGIYSDRHTIFQSPKGITIEEELAGKQSPLTNFGLAMAELGISHIKARTPQAKGRVERLWQTFQDRLIQELRIENINTLEEANEILLKLIRRHNEKFSVQAKDPIVAYRPLPKEVQLEHVFSVRETRRVGSGETISYKGKLYKIKGNSYQNIPVRTTVEVRKTMTGELIVYYHNNVYELVEVSKEKRVRESQKMESVKESVEQKTPRKPSTNHPWRQYKNKLDSTIAQ